MMMLKPVLPAFVLLALAAGCSQHAAQSTSGAAYLARSVQAPLTPQPITERRVVDGKLVETEIQTVSTDQLIRQAADIEPLLQLPARIGLARLENGALTTIPAGESAVWKRIAARHAGLGSFAAIDPFLAGYVVRTVVPQDTRTLRRDIGDVITKIRLGAARQHMDAVLIYEVGMRPNGRTIVAGLGPIRVLGAAPLPDRPIEAEGVARAFLMDVRNGYPYGVASASVDLGELDRPFWDDKPEDRHGIEAKARITTALAPEVEAMFGQLTRQMQARLATAN
jgi:hypothetical protein